MTDSPSPTPGQIRYGQRSADRHVVPGFGRAGALAGAAVIVIALGGLVWAAAAGHVVSAQRPQLFGGSMVLQDDSHPFPVIDLATGNVTIRVAGVDADVRASGYQDVQAVPVDSGTMLVNTTNGTFNLLGADNFVLDTAGGGVGLGRLKGLTGASAVGAGAGAYIVLYASPRSTVSLVDQATVASGAKLEAGTAGGLGRGPTLAVTPRGFSGLAGPVADQPGSSAASLGDLWILVGDGSRCQVVQLHPVPTGHNGLLPTTRATLPGDCHRMALDAVGANVAVAWPGHVRLFPSGSAGAGYDASVATGTATQFLPVRGNSPTLWFLADGPAGWSVFGSSPAGRVSRVAALAQFGSRAAPVEPVVSGDLLYSLDQHQAGQPTLWSIVPGSGAMVPIEVQGSTTYPSAGKSEKAAFGGTQVLVDGPRVIFNNPGSLKAVVIFTDGTHPPVVVDKASAPELSSTGPAQIATPASGSGTSKSRRSRSSNSQPRSVPVVQAVNQNVTCANTTQKPYAPQISSVTPSSGSALVTWSYQLLDVTDCEPDSWAVHVTAISGSHQPDQPTQVVNGQDQLDFTGLRPATTYQVVVTAYINAQSTPSTPTTFTTSPRGPDAPTSVHTTVNAAGDWVVSWSPCITAKCVVPADVWNVVGSACGSSFVPQPPSVQVSASQNTVTLNADSLGLLGDSLSFSVDGQLSSGLSGNPTADNECSQSWRAPVASDISVAGSGQVSGQTVTAHLQVSTSAAVSSVQALGSRSTEYVFHVGSVNLPPTSSPTATVPGLAAGQTYTPSVAVYPAGHPAATVTVSGPPFTQNLQWPALSLVANQVTTANNQPSHSGTETLSIGGFSGLAPGQAYVVDPKSSYTCSATSAPLPGLGPNATITIPGIGLDDFGGPCTANLWLDDDTPHNPYGGVNLPGPLSASFPFPSNLPNYSSSFTVSLSQNCIVVFCDNAQLQVSYTPAGQPPAGDRWTITTSASGTGHGNGGGGCDPTTTQPPGPNYFPVSVQLNCSGPDAQNVNVVINYQYLGHPQIGFNQTPGGTPGTTTTTTSTTTTTTTTVAKSTTTNAGGTPTAVARGGVPGVPAQTELAAARDRDPAGRADSRQVFEASLVMLLVALCAGVTRRGLYRRQHRKGDS